MNALQLLQNKKGRTSMKRDAANQKTRHLAGKRQSSEMKKLLRARPPLSTKVVLEL